jgi:hypothetical protein
MDESTLPDDVAQRIGEALGFYSLSPEDLLAPEATAADVSERLSDLAEGPLAFTQEDLVSYIRGLAAEAGWFLLGGQPARPTAEPSASPYGWLVLVWQGEVFESFDPLMLPDGRLVTALAAVREAGQEWFGSSEVRSR